MTAPRVLSLILWQASLLRMSNARILEGYLGGMEARFVGGVCLLLVAIGTSACTGVISPPPIPRISLADASNNRVVRMDDMPGAAWTPFGPFGTGMNQFRFPSGIYVSAAGQIFVTDAFNHRIVRMDNMTGAGWIVLGGPPAGSGPGQFNGPFGIFVSAGQIYVADTNNHRIVRMDNMTGTAWTALGGPPAGSGMNQFNSPSGIFVSAGQIYVADWNNNRIVRMNDMAGTGWTPVGTLRRCLNTVERP